MLHRYVLVSMAICWIQARNWHIRMHFIKLTHWNINWTAEQWMHLLLPMTESMRIKVHTKGLAKNKGIYAASCKYVRRSCSKFPTHISRQFCNSSNIWTYLPDKNMRKQRICTAHIVVFRDMLQPDAKRYNIS